MTIAFSPVSTRGVSYSMNSQGCILFTVAPLWSLKYPSTCICWQEVISVRHKQEEPPLEPLFPFLSNTSTQCIFWDYPTQHCLNHYVDAARRPVGPLSHQPLRSDTFSWFYLSDMMKRFPKCSIATTRAFNGVCMRAVSSEWQPRTCASSRVNLVLMEHRRAAWFILWDLLHLCINGAHSHTLNIRGWNLLPTLLESISILLGVNGKDNYNGRSEF